MNFHFIKYFLNNQPWQEFQRALENNAHSFQVDVFDCSDAMVQLLFTKANVKTLLKYLPTEMKGFKIFK